MASAGAEVVALHERVALQLGHAAGVDDDLLEAGGALGGGKPGEAGGCGAGQTDAVQMGMARALALMKPDAKPALRKSGFLTRDPSIKERKKPGLKRARKAPTYTKR